MAPRPPSEPASDGPENVEDQRRFEKSLTEFAEQRGIHVEPIIRVAGKEIELYKLYNLVTSKGGYDALSAEKLAWRKIGGDFHLGSANAAAYAFALKTAYYKNLAAYEIKFMHGREPPPVDILENLTAKGGDILNRTVDNFRPPPLRTGLANGGSDSEDELAKTPKDEKIDIDDPTSGGTGGRATRGLRQQPPQRILFQPDMSSSRNLRHSSGHGQSPQTMPNMNPHSSFNNLSSQSNGNFSFSNYEPRPQMPMSLRPVTTPGNNYGSFSSGLKRVRDARRVAAGLKLESQSSVVKPGAGYEGPNIYVRILQGLRCPLRDEQDYALHHLVKISHERGDKYKFEAFPGLAEGLIEYVLKAGSIFYDVEWEFTYEEDANDVNVLDGINGTPDILQRIQCLKRIDRADGLDTGQFNRDITKASEAGLTMRNLALLEENAIYLADMPQARDMLSIVLNLPDLPQVAELKHYALDIAEQLTKFWRMHADDPLYISLLKVVDEGRDRGAILTALRSLCRISLTLSDQNLLEGVPSNVIRRMIEWGVLEDEELVGTSLDFLYQYTANVENINFLLSNADDLALAPFFGQLTRLISYRTTTANMKIPQAKAVPPVAATEIPSVPADLLEHFLKHDEPDRSNQWLRAVFEEDPESNITQIALWQAYQTRFTEHVTTQTGLLPAAEFIKNVSTIFQGANAQVVQGDQPKFIIKGIRPRHAPVDTKGNVYTRCQWKVPGSKQCPEFQLKGKPTYDHIAQAHFGLKKKADGRWNLQSTADGPNKPTDCFWAGCHHFARLGKAPPSMLELGLHVKTHLPDRSSKASHRAKYNRTAANQTVNPAVYKDRPDFVPDIDPQLGRDATYKYFTFQSTPFDEYGHSFGIPFTSILILRNVARNIPKAVSVSQGGDDIAVRQQWMEKLLAPSKERLSHIMAHNRTLVNHVSDLLSTIDKGLSE